MNWNWAFAGAITTLIMGPWNVGLAGDRPVIRAQNGAVYPASHAGYSSNVYYQDECEEDHCGPLGHLHGCWHYMITLGGKQGGGSAQRDPQQLNFDYRYRYKYPRDLRYPAANQPAGVVVYPYYTVKGPDDFFLNDPPAPYWP